MKVGYGMLIMLFLVMAHGHAPKQQEILTASPEAVLLIKKYEGFSPKPYLCPAGIPAIGYGSTRYLNGTVVTISDKKITKHQANLLLQENILSFERNIRKLIKVELTQNQFDAILSLTYNIGTGSLKSSRLLKFVNKNPDDLRIKSEFLKWRKASGVVVKGLETRRASEAELYFTK